MAETKECKYDCGTRVEERNQIGCSNCWEVRRRLEDFLASSDNLDFAKHTVARREAHLKSLGLGKTLNQSVTDLTFLLGQVAGILGEEGVVQALIADGEIKFGDVVGMANFLDLYYSSTGVKRELGLVKKLVTDHL